jgi:hypothetical protein
MWSVGSIEGMLCLHVYCSDLCYDDEGSIFRRKVCVRVLHYMVTKLGSQFSIITPLNSTLNMLLATAGQP